MAVDWTAVRQCLEFVALEAFHTAHRLLARGGEALVGQAADGDIVARIDRETGMAIRTSLRLHCPVPCALLDEEHGVLGPIHDHPVIGIIADEFDGTRPGRLVIPTNAICLAAYLLDEAPVLRNVRVGVMHLLTREQFSFQREARAEACGVWRNRDPWIPDVTPSPLGQLRLLYEHVGGHSVLTEMYLAPFAQAHRYGAVVLASSAYACSRIVAGHAELYIHLPARIRRQWPELAPLINALHGPSFGQYPWDLATTVPLLWQAGCLATRTDGSSLEDVSLTDTRPENRPDFLAASTPAAHGYAVNALADQERRLLAQKDDILRLLRDERLWVRPSMALEPAVDDDDDASEDTVISLE